jgi:hypothetical protein
MDTLYVLSLRSLDQRQVRSALRGVLLSQVGLLGMLVVVTYRSKRNLG